jgi:hypothetical protein
MAKSPTAKPKPKSKAKSKAAATSVLRTANVARAAGTQDTIGCLTLVWVGIGVVVTAGIGALVADHFNAFKATVPSAVKPIASASAPIRRDSSTARPAPQSFPPLQLGAIGGTGSAPPGSVPGSGSSAAPAPGSAATTPAARATPGGKPPAPPPPQLASASPAHAVPASPVPSLPVPHVAPLDIPPPPGTPAWVAYAVPPLAHSGGIVTVVIDDMGLDRKRSARAVELPGPLTLSYMSYADELNAQTTSAHQHGHELLMHMPMEPKGSLNPGPEALDVGLSLEEIDRRLQHNLGRFQGFVGINNHMGSKFTAYRPGMELVMAALRARGMLWLDSRTTANTVGPALAASYQVPFAQRDVFLDDVPSLSAVNKQLHEVENIALHKGRAIAIGHPKDATLQALASWLPSLRRENLTLVPLSEMVKAQEATFVQSHPARPGPE